jgi:prophage antirepressor-like protein
MQKFELSTLGVSIRVVGTQDAPLFVAKDIAVALGYADPINAIKQHCRGVAYHHPITDALGRTQEVRVITESDLYRLIIGSKLPSAVRFEAWVMEEVLPTIRKTGSYAAPKFEVPTTLSAALRLAADQAETIEAQAKQIEAAKPAIAFADRHANATNLMSIRASAKALKFKESAFIDAMLRDKLIFRDASGRLMPYAETQRSGIFDVVTGEAGGHAYLQTKITASGLQKLACRYASELGE